MKNNSYSTQHLGGNISLFRKLVVCLMLLAFTGVEMFAQTTIIGAGANVGATSSNAGPIYRSTAGSSFDFSKHVYLYTAAELATAGINAGDNITSVAWNKSNAFGTAATNNVSIWRVYIKNSSAVPGAGWSSTNFATQTTGSTLAYNNTAQVIPLTTGYITLTFSSPFVYTGGNLEIASDFDCSLFAGSPTTGGFAWRSDNLANTCYGGSNSTSTITMASQTIRPQIQIGYSAGAPCAGQPNPGNTIASAAAVCSGSSVNLSLQNSTTGSGVSFVWEHSDDDVNWTPFGTSAPGASFSMGATPKYFHCIVSCVNDPNPGISNSVLVGVNPFLNCYCASNATNPADTKIDSVELGTLYVGTSPTACETYTNNTAVPAPIIYFNTPQSMRVRNGSCSGNHYGAYVAVFIDINQSGTYEDPAERVASYNTTTALNSVPLFNFTIPTGGPSGLTGMRVIIKESSAITACGTYTYGETEDYVVDLQPEPVCIDPPTAGSAQSNITQFCNTTLVNLNLSLSGTSGGTGQTYQWQYSFDDVDYFDIGGATTASWTENNVSISYYYRCNVTCGSSTVPSSSVFVQAVPPPSAGSPVSGPASAYVNQAASYSSSGATGTLKWLARLVPSTTWSVVAGATGDPQNIFFGGPGTYEVRLVSSVFGCTDDSSNIVTTVVTLQGDNVCDAVPVNIGVNGPYSNVGATLETGESQPPATGCTGNSSWCVAANQTVWFTFTVPMGGSGRYGVGFSPGNWDSQVAVWSASACGDLLTGAAVLVAANDDSSGSSPYNSYASAHCLTPGQTYYIQVDGYSSTTNSAFGLRIDDLGPADASFSGIGATVCENAGLVTLTPAVAGGTFSGTGVSGNSFDPALAAAGFHTITYTMGGFDICYSSNQTVEVVTPTYTYYADVDGDTYGNAGSSILSCEVSAPVGYSADATDCDDNNPSVNPGAIEICNSIDDNCNGLTDEGFDADNDGFTSCGGDCNDNDNTVYPGATEVCNNVDDDCNLLVDDGLTFITYYADVDGDTYGDASSSVSTCNGAPVGYVGNSSDCDDNNAAVNPAATEICNLIDDDCNGLIDENILVAGPISGPSVQCMAVVTGSATFSISPVFDASGYSWTVPNGMIIVSGQGTTSIFVSWAPQAVNNGIIGNVTVTPSNSCGAGVSGSLATDINAVIPVRPSSISGTTKLCPGDNAVYSVAPVARASNYVWTLPAGMSITAGAGTNVITVDVDGAYLGGTVSCRAANACGISPNRDRSVSINVPSVSASISGPATGVCGSTGVAYTAAAVFSATGYNWSVPVGATITSGQGTQSIVVDFDGAYGGGNVSVSATNACGVGSARNLNVSGAPGLPGVITGDITICPGQTGVAYGVSTVTGASSYLWSLPGGTTITSGQGTKDILATWGTNPASGLNLSVNASNGCGTSANRVLNGISISIAHCGPRFGDQGEITGLNVYPNPAADRATVVFTSTEGADFNIKMVDVSGRTIMTERGTATNGLNQREVNVSEMSAGIYFVVIETNNVVEQIKMIVE